VPRSRAYASDLSPDGRWLAYASNESGRYEVYVRRYRDAGGRRQISTNGGLGSVWAPSGRELYFRSGDSIMAVDIATEPVLAAGRARRLFEWPYEPSYPVFRSFDVSPDGRHFVMMQPDGEPPPPQFRIVLNWFQELKSLVPTS